MTGHAYGITCVRKVALGGGLGAVLRGREKVRLVRLRNPWGMGEDRGGANDG